MLRSLRSWSAPGLLESAVIAMMKSLAAWDSAEAAEIIARNRIEFAQNSGHETSVVGRIIRIVIVPWIDSGQRFTSRSRYEIFRFLDTQIWATYSLIFVV